MSQAVQAFREWRENPSKMVRDLFGVEPDLWQDEVLQAFPHQQRIALKASKGVGKAQPLSLLLYTPIGLRRFGDLKAGDEVFAEDGSPTRIKNVYDRGELPVYRVYFDDGSFTDCCGEHLWKVRGQNEKARKHAGSSEIWSVLTTEQIIDRGVRVKNGRWSGRQFEIPTHLAAQFPSTTLSIDPYVLGVWLGDGSSGCGKYTDDDLEIDREVIDRGYQIRRHADGHGKNISVTVYGLSQQLREMGIKHLNSHERFVPDAYKTGCISQRKDILAGLLDTDGCVGKEGHIEFSSTSKRLAEDVVHLVRSLGGNSSINNTVKKPFYYKDGNKIIGRDCYRVSIATPFNPFKVSKKSERWHKPTKPSQLRYLKRYIDRIELMSVQHCMCIEVEHHSHCYLTNDFIVTHNTSLEAWLIWNFLLTRPHPKIAAVAISADNLSDNLWTELALWRGKSELLKSKFTWTKTRIFANEAPETWWCSARSWSKTADSSQQAQTLAGLHANYIMFVLDESGGMPESIMPAAEAALSACTEGHVIQAGNPTHLEGPLYRACTRDRSQWMVREISGAPNDPKRSPRVSIAWAQDQIDKYGADNPYVLVNVFGQFPPNSLNALLGPDEVVAAQKRILRADQWSFSGRRLGIDVARFGDDRCFDNITEILTDEGWKLFSDLRGDERVLSIDKDKASWEKIEHIHQADFDGELNLLEKKHLNFCITDNHRMLVRKNPKSLSYKFAPYKDLPRDFVVREENGWAGRSPDKINFETRRKMPNGGHSHYCHEFDYVDWATFLGWFVSEGNVYIHKKRPASLRTIISQNPGKKQQDIMALLKKMGIKARLCSTGRQIEFTSQSIGMYLRENCGVLACNKRVPDEIKNGSEAVIRAFLNSFLLGDGTCRKDGNGRCYITSSKQLADDIQEMLAKLGCAGKLRLKEKAGSVFYIGKRRVVRSHDTYVIYERSSLGGKHVHKKDVKRVAYKGKIWCVATRFESIYVRRKGIPMWSGNTVIFPRQGLLADQPIIMRNARSEDIAAKIAFTWENQSIDDACIDDTGGWAAGVVDLLNRTQYAVTPINFSSKALDDRYFNRRSEMYFLLAEWIKGGGALPDIPELVEELTATTYWFDKGKLRLEDKDHIKMKLGRSPDLSDGLALTFSVPQTIKGVRLPKASSGNHTSSYNPLDRDYIKSDTGSSQHQVDYRYDPRRG